MNNALMAIFIGYVVTIAVAIRMMTLQSDKRPTANWAGFWVKELKSGNWAEREEALKQLSHPDCKPAVLKIVQLLKKEKDWQVAVQAVKTLENIGDPQGIPGIVGALYHIHPWVRREAALALGDLGDRMVIPDLIQIAERDHDPDARYGAIVALGKLRAVAAVDVLNRFTGSDEKTRYFESLSEAAESALFLIR